MFLGIFRPGEVMAGSVTDLSFRALRRGDVSTRVDRIILTLHISQTDQLGRGQRITLRPCPEEAFCPVDSLHRYVDMRP